MNRKLVIKIRKPSQADFLVYVIIILPFLFGFLIDIIKLPTVIKYVCDLAWLALLLLMFLQHWRMTGEQKLLLGVILGFLCYTLVGYIVNYQSPLYYLWGLRNNFRMYVFFAAVVMFGKAYTCDKLIDFFDRVFWVNAAVCLVQFFVLGKEQDFLGGIFGVEKGCNAWLNNYFVIVTTWSILGYLNEEKSLTDCVLKCGTMLLIAALAELKFYYVEFVMILAMAVLVTSFSWRKILIIVGGIIGVVLTTQLLEKLFPIFKGAFTLKAMYEIAANDSGYTSKGDINRLNAIGVVTERFLKTFPKQMVGLGLGNCDTASFAMLNTPFYQKYSFLNYTWFSSAFVFLETGYIGMCFYFGFFLLVFLLARKIAKRQPQKKQYCLMTMICAVCCFLISIYNSSLRTEAGYMIYFILALPFIKNAYPHVSVNRDKYKSMDYMGNASETVDNK